jgi:hypothetical protein
VHASEADDRAGSDVADQSELAEPTDDGEDDEALAAGDYGIDSDEDA